MRLKRYLTEMSERDIINMLKPYKPELIKRFKDNIDRVFRDMVADIGPELKHVYNNRKWVNVFDKMIKPYLAPTKSNIMWSGEARQLDKNKIDKGAEVYAEDTLKAWADKIDEKVGLLDNVEIHNLTGTSFRISGKKDGHDVYIEQQMIINVSARRTLFNQFPARIRVDGKPISAAKFKKL